VSLRLARFAYASHHHEVSQSPSQAELERFQRGELRKRDLALLCLGAVLGTSMYAAFVPEAPLPQTVPAVHTAVKTVPHRAKTRIAGSAIDVEWHGAYFHATVVAMTPDGRVRIHYDGYGDVWDEDVTDERIREQTVRPRTDALSESRE